MFKKYSKEILEKELTPPGFPELSPFSSPLKTPILREAHVTSPPQAPCTEPETTISENVSMKGTLSFQHLLRIDGSFEGELHSQGKLIIGPKGHVKAHLDLDEAFISGRVEGNITVRTRLVLRGRAEVHGNISAPSLSVDEGVSITGFVNVGKSEPEPIRLLDSENCRTGESTLF